MTFPSVDAAQLWARTHRKHIFVEIENVRGVLEVYPGGRMIFRAADGGKVYERYRTKLTPDHEFEVVRPGSDPIKALAKLLRDSDARIKFGLVQQGHIPMIEKMLANGATWDEIGEVIHWDPATAKRYYENYKAVRP